LQRVLEILIKVYSFSLSVISVVKIYNIAIGNGVKISPTNNNLQISGSVPVYSAKPPQIPNNFLLVLLRLNIFLFIFLVLFLFQIFKVFVIPSYHFIGKCTKCIKYFFLVIFFFPKSIKVYIIKYFIIIIVLRV